MKALSYFPLLLLAAAALLGAQVRAETAAAVPDQPNELTIVIVESLSGPSTESNTYERLARVFEDAFEAKKWPLKIETERLAANSGPHPLEVRVFFQGIRSDVPSGLTFRGWVTFQDRGTKHDFGVIRYEYFPRPGENTEDKLERTIRGAADIAASKVGAILYPTAANKR